MLLAVVLFIVSCLCWLLLSVGCGCVLLVDYSPMIVHCLLFVGCWLLQCVVWCVSFVVRRLWLNDCWRCWLLLFVIVVFVVCCLLIVVGCLLSVVVRRLLPWVACCVSLCSRVCVDLGCVLHVVCRVLSLVVYCLMRVVRLCVIGCLVFAFCSLFVLMFLNVVCDLLFVVCCLL